ncbi:hypothetical protein TWF694_003145 [Orbilia ellipsospora]|uniref:Uncharacterized protein n=1 Tax=Orbilia ellipsospora TaxID=2528407 RepID=A0AAV9X0Q2_9PEZI
MRFLLAILALLVNKIAAQSCLCQCTIDSCLGVLAVTTASAFFNTNYINDCRSYLWTHSTVADTTINAIRRVTLASTFTRITTNTVTVETSITGTATASGTTTITSSLTVTAFTTKTSTSTVIAQTSTTGTVTQLSTVTATLSSTVTDSTTITLQKVETQTSSSLSLYTTTVTSTITASTKTVGVPIESLGSKLRKRQGNGIPAYAAGVCSNQDAYSSACTCIGVTTGGTTYITVDIITLGYTITSNVSTTETITQLATSTVTIDVSTTKTIIEDITAVISSSLIVTEVATAVVTSTVTILASTTTTITQGATATTISEITETETNTQSTTLVVTVLASSASTVINDQTTTLTSLISSYTQFAIQATDDDANGGYKGQYMYSYMNTTDNLVHVAFTSDITKVSLYASDPDGNVTGPNLEAGSGWGIHFAVVNNQTYQLDNTISGSQAVGCWIESINSTWIFQCQGAGAEYMSFRNSTGDLMLYDGVWEIYPNSTGPAVLQAVPFPTSSAAPAPSAVAQQFNIHYFNSSSVTNPYATYWLGSQTESGTGYERLCMVSTQAAAKVFVADPATGNIYDIKNQPFAGTSFGQQAGIPIYSLFPPIASIGIFGCSLNGTRVFCHREAYQYVAIGKGLNGASDEGTLGIWTSLTALATGAWLFDMEAVML